MPVDVVLLSAYALVLLGAAHGLRALGHRSTSPWASRTMAGNLRAGGQDPEPLHSGDWPHSEVPRLYTGMSLVAAVAAAALSLGGLVLHHDGSGLVVLVFVLALSTGTVVKMVRGSDKR